MGKKIRTFPCFRACAQPKFTPLLLRHEYGWFSNSFNFFKSGQMQSKTYHSKIGSIFGLWTDSLFCLIEVPTQHICGQLPRRLINTTKPIEKLQFFMSIIRNGLGNAVRWWWEIVQDYKVETSCMHTITTLMRLFARTKTQTEPKSFVFLYEF